MKRVRTYVVLIGLLLLSLTKTALALPAVEDVVMYEVNPRAFSDSGDLHGVTESLDRIAGLGANVIWLMPIHPIGQERSVGGLGSPYSVRDYLAVNPELGDLDDLRELINAAHERDIAVILDWVANHTAWDHAWVAAHPDWYTKDEAGDITHPPGTNWLDVADLNYDSPALRQGMINAMIYWVCDVGVDGFRCDFSDGVPIDFWQDAIEQVRASVDRSVLMLAEGTRPENLTHAGFDLNYDWSFYDALKKVFVESQPPSLILRTHAERYRGLPAGRHWLRWTSNHDQHAWDASPIEIFEGEEASLAAFAAALYVGGVPLIYNGQEIGVAETISFFERASIDWSVDAGLRERYIQLIESYNAHPVLRNGRLTNLSNQDVLAFVRYEGDQRALILINTRPKPSDITLPWSRSWLNRFSGELTEIPRRLSLDPHEIRLLIQP
ncbi:MAG: alpha-amylase family glycosyl hydrolase [Phycisphaeraceae bacterium]